MSAVTDRLHPDRLFPADPAIRDVARRLYSVVRNLPIISPHGHTDPEWFAANAAFPNPAKLLLTPDHYVFRMLYSQGVKLEEFGVSRIDGGETEQDARRIWSLFAQNYFLFRGTPTRMWFDWVLANVFELPVPLTRANADKAYDTIAEKLQQDAFRPRALFERFNIEALATTESPLDDLRHHIAIRKSGWSGRVVTAYRPDPVVDPDAQGFVDNLHQFSEIS
ncbi:MAG: glucuronate isomerase, partial [Povalibacter sp.]